MFMILTELQNTYGNTTELQRASDNFTITVGNWNSGLSTIDRISGKKTRKGTENLSNTVNQLNLYLQNILPDKNRTLKKCWEVET